jgi:small-conductance mechanosensitive channel
MVELEDGTRGFVEEMTIRYTKIITLDNTFAVIPNSNVHDQQVINYSAEDERTRVSLSFLATYDSDIFRAQEVLERAARQVDIVVGGGPDIRIGSARYSAGPAAYVDEYADSGILITMRYWTTKPYKLLKLRSMVHENLVELLANEPTVEAAYPHQHLLFDDTSGVARVTVEDGADGRDRAPAGDGAAADGRSDGGTRRANRDPGPDADPGRGPGA